jgi:hypothetical protein
MQQHCSLTHWHFLLKQELCEFLANPWPWFRPCVANINTQH